MPLATSRVLSATTAPNEEWAANQAREFVQVAEAQGLAPKMVVRDRDTKFGPVFDRVLRARGIRPMNLSHSSPNLNAYAERLVRSMRDECLSKIVPIGERHLRHAIGEFAAHYHFERNHQGLSNRLIDGEAEPEPVPVRRVQRRERLGGPLRSYHRAA